MHRNATAVLYGPPMARPKRVLMGVDKTRKSFAERINAAEQNNEHTIVVRYGKPVAALVSIDWLRKAAEALGEPTDL